MSATTIKQHGADGIWGIAADESSLITTSVTHSATASKKENLNRVGNAVSVVYYNPKVEITIEGTLKTTCPAKVGNTLTLANDIADISYESASSGVIVVESVDYKYMNEDYVAVSIKATNHLTVEAT